MGSHFKLIVFVISFVWDCLSVRKRRRKKKTEGGGGGWEISLKTLNCILNDTCSLKRHNSCSILKLFMWETALGGRKHQSSSSLRRARFTLIFPAIIVRKIISVIEGIGL